MLERLLQIAKAAQPLPTSRRGGAPFSQSSYGVLCQLDGTVPPTESGRPAGVRTSKNNLGHSHESRSTSRTANAASVDRAGRAPSRPLSTEHLSMNTSRSFAPWRLSVLDSLGMSSGPGPAPIGSVAVSFASRSSRPVRCRRIPYCRWNFRKGRSPDRAAGRPALVDYPASDVHRRYSVLYRTLEAVLLVDSHRVDHESREHVRVTGARPFDPV